MNMLYSRMASRACSHAEFVNSAAFHHSYDWMTTIEQALAAEKTKLEQALAAEQARGKQSEKSEL
jgi:hypothetical protein